MRDCRGSSALSVTQDTKAETELSIDTRWGEGHEEHKGLSQSLFPHCTQARPRLDFSQPLPTPSFRVSRIP